MSERRGKCGVRVELLLAVALLSSATGAARADAESPETAGSSLRRGTVDYVAPADEGRTPERFRLAAHQFTFEEQPTNGFSQRIGKSLVRFPSPVRTDVEANNTVHCEYYYPKRPGKAPAVVVLHILGGDFPLARAFANHLAQNGVAALFLKMPYYGERRDPNSPRRMIASDPRDTLAGMTQAILDIRRATAWLAARDEVDSKRLGVFGISLGGITGALAATAEPRLENVCLLLAGGDLAQVAWESKELAKLRKEWQAAGGTKEQFCEILGEVDPVRYGQNVRGRRILLMNATHDEVVPKACTEALWESFGRPELVWFSGGHYSAAWHLFSAMNRASRFFANDTLTEEGREKTGDR